jgi:nicotinamidase-related amidase
MPIKPRSAPSPAALPAGTLPWLAIIDMQNVFTGTSPWACPDFNGILSPIGLLAAKFGNRTLLTRFTASQQPQGSWVTYYSPQWFQFAEVPPTSPLYDLVPPMQALANADNVVTMTTFNKWGDATQGLCAKTGPTPYLVLAGVATDCCVLSTAIAAAEAGAFVTVVMDACAGSSAQNQQAAQAIFTGYAPLITVTTTAQLLGG